MTNAVQQTQYHYVQGGNKQFAYKPPPPGVAYDKVVNGKVVERYVLSNGVLARVLTEEQQTAAAKTSATEARNAAAKAAVEKANSEIGAAHAKHVAARNRLGAAGQELNGAMAAFYSELQKVNTGLGYQDVAQDTVDYTLAVAGVVVAVGALPVSAAGLVVIGVGTGAVGLTNAILRPDGVQADDLAGLAGDSVGVAADLATGAGAVVRYAPALGVVGGVAGAYSAKENTARNLRVPSWDGAGLNEFKGQLADFSPTMVERLSLKASGADLENLERLRAETAAAQVKYDAARAEDRAAAQAYAQTVITWVKPKG